MHFFDYSLSLIPSDEYANRIRGLSQKLGLEFGEFQPHITLLPLDSTVDIEVYEIDLTTKGYYCDIGSERRAWHGLKLQHSDELHALRREMTKRYSVDTERVSTIFRI